MDCFDGSTARVKTLLSSKWFGKTGTTGIFIAFTGESSISSTTFTASVPFTMCHEIGHRMAFARENEGQILPPSSPAEASEDARFTYSGYYGLPLLLQCAAQGRCRCGKRGLERRVRRAACRLRRGELTL